jgi:hypothetical protein
MRHEGSQTSWSRALQKHNRCSVVPTGKKAAIFMTPFLTAENSLALSTTWQLVAAEQLPHRTLSFYLLAKDNVYE